LLSAAELSHVSIISVQLTHFISLFVFLSERCSFLFIVLFLLWFDQSPLFLTLDGDVKRSVVIASAVVTDTSVPPELIGTESNSNNISVVELVVVTDPAADKSPCSLYSWVSRESSLLSRLTT
jgi:hypothetical protein